MVRKYKDKNDWDPWIKLQQNREFWDVVDEEFEKFVQAYPKNMRKAVVLALSIAKWHRRNPNRGKRHCAACIYSFGACCNCYANKVCEDQKSLYFQFSQTGKEEYADQIYDILRADYDKEMKKVEKR